MNKEDHIEDAFIPESNLEFNMLCTNPVWGNDQEVNQAFRDKTTKNIQFVNKETGEVIKTTQEKLWEQLQFFTRDLRLGNLGSIEIKTCNYYLDLANDLLKEHYLDAFIISISRVAAIIELSQSKGGFLRKRLNTFTKESKESFDMPKKNGLFHQKQKGY